MHLNPPAGGSGDLYRSLLASLGENAVLSGEHLVPLAEAPGEPGTRTDCPSGTAQHRIMPIFKT